jgi:hypothetical protein
MCNCLFFFSPPAIRQAIAKGIVAYFQKCEYGHLKSSLFSLVTDFSFFLFFRRR